MAYYEHVSWQLPERRGRTVMARPPTHHPIGMRELPAAVLRYQRVVLIHALNLEQPLLAP